MIKILSKFFITLFLLCPSISNSFAAYGNTCSPRVLVPSNPTTQDSTLYGYLINNITVTFASGDKCIIKDEIIRFCIKKNATGGGCWGIELEAGTTKKLSEISKFEHVGCHPLLKDVALSVVRIGNSICLTMPSSQGPLALVCKITDAAPPPPPPPPSTCKGLGESCYSGNSKSQSLFNFTGVAVHCLQETLDKVFYRESDCVPDPNQSEEISLITPFPVFQQNMTNAIRIALALYVVFFGIRIALNPGSSDLNSAATFVIKMLLVMYFSVGLGPSYYENGKPTVKTGMLEYVLPALTGATPEFARIVFNSGGARGLCEFDVNKYDKGYAFYGLWDAIDCRIGYYLGVSLLYNTSNLLPPSSSTYDPPGSTGSSDANLGNKGKDGIDTLDSPVVPRFFTVMFGFFLGGNIIVVAAGIAFAVVFMSVILHFLSSYLVCLITLYTMTYISPIFIPMALFNRTKSYYDAWLRVVVSCTLQPAVLAGFVALLLNMYDTAIFKNCQFRRHDYQTPQVTFSTFEIRLPTSGVDECKSSAGYKLLKYYIGQGWEHIGLILIKINYIRDVFSLMVELLYVIVFTIIFYYFSQTMSQFAADITNGPMMNAVTTGPTKLMDAIKSAASFISQAAQSAGGGSPPKSGGGGSGDTGSVGRAGGPSGDTASMGGGGSSDTASSGGGGSPDTGSIGKGK